MRTYIAFLKGLTYCYFRKYKKAIKCYNKALALNLQHAATYITIRFGFITFVAVAKQLDAFVSGEVSERTTHIAREEGIHYYAVGHHATERYGVQALAEKLVQQFSLRHTYIEVQNPV